MSMSPATKPAFSVVGPLVTKAAQGDQLHKPGQVMRQVPLSYALRAGGLVADQGGVFWGGTVSYGDVDRSVYVTAGPEENGLRAVRHLAFADEADGSVGPFHAVKDLGDRGLESALTRFGVIGDSSSLVVAQADSGHRSERFDGFHAVGGDVLGTLGTASVLVNRDDLITQMKDDELYDGDQPYSDFCRDSWVVQRSRESRARPIRPLPSQTSRTEVLNPSAVQEHEKTLHRLLDDRVPRFLVGPITWLLDLGKTTDRNRTYWQNVRFPEMRRAIEAIRELGGVISPDLFFKMIGGEFGYESDEVQKGLVSIHVETLRVDARAGLNDSSSVQDRLVADAIHLFLGRIFIENPDFALQLLDFDGLASNRYKHYIFNCLIGVLDGGALEPGAAKPILMVLAKLITEESDPEMAFYMSSRYFETVKNLEPFRELVVTHEHTRHVVSWYFNRVTDRERYRVDDSYKFNPGGYVRLAVDVATVMIAVPAGHSPVFSQHHEERFLSLVDASPQIVIDFLFDLYGRYDRRTRELLQRVEERYPLNRQIRVLVAEARGRCAYSEDDVLADEKAKLGQLSQQIPEAGDQHAAVDSVVRDLIMLGSAALMLQVGLPVGEELSDDELFSDVDRERVASWLLNAGVLRSFFGAATYERRGTSSAAHRAHQALARVAGVTDARLVELYEEHAADSPRVGIVVAGLVGRYQLPA